MNEHGLIQAFNDGYDLGTFHRLPKDRKDLFSNDEYLEAVKSGLVQFLKDHPQSKSELEGFNLGYTVSQNYPRLADKIEKTKRIDPAYLKSFLAGKRELTNELVKGKDYWKKSKTISKSITQTKGRGKTR